MRTNGQKKMVGWVFVAAALTACSDKAPVESLNPPSLKDTVAAAVGGAPSPVVPKIDTSTPDFALKSWWAYLDEQQEYEYRTCQKLSTEAKEFRNSLGLLLAGDPLKARQSFFGGCQKTKIDRQIKKVHMETETRSVIEVVMRDAIGPRPDEVVPNYAKKGVEHGFQYRYVLAKTPEGWRIEDVLQWSDTAVVLKRDPWDRVYRDEPKGYFFNLSLQ